MNHPALIPEMLLCSLRYLLLKAIAAVFLVAFLPWAGLAQEKGPDSPSLKPKPKLKLKTLAAFKNGMGFCVKTGQVNLRDGWATVEELPSASLGALWVGTDAKNGSVTDLVAVT